MGIFNRYTNAKLTSSVSEHNVFFTYVCLVNDVNPYGSGNNSNRSAMDHASTRPSINDIETDADRLNLDQPIQVERSKAVHELVESRKSGERDKTILQSSIQNVTKPNEDIITMLNNDSTEHNENPNILKLTKMKWLTEDQDDSSDSSSPSLSPTISSCSVCSRESYDAIDQCISFGDKCLSTILRLDREHNMFGLSNIAIVGRNIHRKYRKEDDKPVFPQTAIIQVCCGRGCCRHKSNTDLPSSLRCGGCHSCCIDPSCPICVGPCGPPCDDPPCPSQCSSCPRGTCICKAPCPPSKCRFDCSTCYGMKISFQRKPKYEPSPIELTPRSSCVLQKPMAARSCHHIPQCLPPSSCFPYLMPCYWPARASAPCNNPLRCFHNPPCRPPRKKKLPICCSLPEDRCATTGKCEDEKNNSKCTNPTCPGTSKASSQHNNLNKEKKQQNKKLPVKKSCSCECHLNICSECFVRRPTNSNIKTGSYHKYTV